MSKRKSPNADLERRRKVYFPMGLIVACSFALAALEWTSFDFLQTKAYGSIPEDFLMEEEIRAYKPKVKPPKPVPKEKFAFSTDPDPEPTPDPNPDPQPGPEPDPFTIGSDLFGDLGELGGEDETEDKVFLAVSRMPHFASCENFLDKKAEKQCTDAEIIRFLQNNVTFPRYLADAGVQGTVHATFVVGKEGEIRDIKIIRGIHQKMDEQVVRAIEKLPQLVPGNQQGRNVSVQMTVPVRFVLR